MELKRWMEIVGLTLMLIVMIMTWQQAQFNAYCEANRNSIELVRNGSYIPIVNRQGKACLSPQLQCLNDLPNYTQTKDFPITYEKAPAPYKIPATTIIKH